MSYDASITYKTFLMYSDGTGENATYKKLVDIKDYPDLIPQKENVETTTLTDKIRTYIEGIMNQDGSLDFTINHDTAAIQILNSLEGKKIKVAVWFGGTEPTDGGEPTPTGELGKVEGTGTVSYSVSGKGVNDVREDIVHVSPSSGFDRIILPA